MKVMLIVKAETRIEATDYVDEKLGPCPIEGRQILVRMGAFRIDVEVENTLPIYIWFNEGQGSAPFPDGTLLWFQVTP